MKYAPFFIPQAFISTTLKLHFCSIKVSKRGCLRIDQVEILVGVTQPIS